MYLYKDGSSGKVGQNMKLKMGLFIGIASSMDRQNGQKTKFTKNLQEKNAEQRLVSTGDLHFSSSNSCKYMSQVTW